MKAVITSLIFMVAISVSGQSLYTKSFGDKNNEALIFLHGGPGYNCANFEATTAQKLADEGFYVIVYDRRGEGRSIDNKAKFTFQQTFEDLNSVYKKYDLKTATLIGHSFGGVVATLYAEKYPNRINSMLLVGAPVSLQETFKTIIESSKIIYQEKKDSVNLKYLTMLEHMDTNSIQYSSYCFMHAMQNGFYSPESPTPEAKNLYSLFKTDTILTKYAAQMTYMAPQGFMDNEKYTSVNLTPVLQKLVSNKINIYGFYGKDDGLYSNSQVLDLQKIIGEQNLYYFENCSHNVFIDQQTEFINALKTKLTR